MFFDQYKEFSEHDPRLLRNDGYRPTIDFLSQRYLAMLPPDQIKNKTIMDIGACVGAAGAWSLANHCQHYTAVEIQSELTTVASNNLKKYFDPASWSVHTQDIEQWVNSDACDYHDIIVLAGTIHTFSDPIATLKKLMEKTDCLIIESSHPHFYSEMLTVNYENDVFTDNDKIIINTLLESTVFKESMRTMFEEKIPVMFNRNSNSLFRSCDLEPTSVVANATYPSIGFLQNIMHSYNFDIDLSINHRLKTALPDLYNFPGRFAVKFVKTSQYHQIPRFQDYDHQ